MEVKELRQKTIKELKQTAFDFRKELAVLQLRRQSVDDKTVWRKKRKELARVLTVLGEKKVLEEL